MDSDNIIVVNVSFSGLQVEFKGNPEEVGLQVNEFLNKQIPNIDLARRISVNYSTKELINMFNGVVKITPEGPRVWVTNTKLSDKDIVALQLVAVKIGKQTGKSINDSLSTSEIQYATSLNPKSVSSRLSELTKMGYIEKEAAEKGVKYRITTQGINWLFNIISKKIPKS